MLDSSSQAHDRVRQSRIAAARALMKGTRPKPSIPRNASADVRFIAAAQEFRNCAKTYIGAVRDHQSFAATHPFDDAAHNEHHERTVAAHRALIGADERYAIAEAALIGQGG